MTPGRSVSQSGAKMNVKRAIWRNRDGLCNVHVPKPKTHQQCQPLRGWQLGFPGSHHRYRFQHLRLVRGAEGRRQAKKQCRKVGAMVFFIGVSSIGKVLSLKSNVNAQKFPLDNTLVYGPDHDTSRRPKRRRTLRIGFAATAALWQENRLFLNEITSILTVRQDFSIESPHGFLVAL